MGFFVMYLCLRLLREVFAAKARLAMLPTHRAAQAQLEAAMTRLLWRQNLGAQFNDFLFAPIDEDANGSLLSVLSALARLDVDP
jgi:hypothetical protein